MHIKNLILEIKTLCTIGSSPTPQRRQRLLHHLRMPPTRRQRETSLSLRVSVPQSGAVGRGEQTRGGGVSGRARVHERSAAALVLPLCAGANGQGVFDDLGERILFLCVGLKF